MTLIYYLLSIIYHARGFACVNRSSQQHKMNIIIFLQVRKLTSEKTIICLKLHNKLSYRQEEEEKSCQLPNRKDWVLQLEVQATNYSSKDENIQFILVILSGLTLKYVEGVIFGELSR